MRVRVLTDKIRATSNRWRLKNVEHLRAYRRKNLVARREYNRKWMAANKDRMAIYFREWNEKNKAKRVKYSQEWKKRHPEFKPDPEKVRGWYAKYRRNNRDKTRAAIARWAKNNLHKRCASAARRRARMGDGSFRKNEQIDRIYARAQWWRKWFDVVVDHVIPLAKGGTHTADNLQIIYAFENTKKHARLDYKPRIVFL